MIADFVFSTALGAVANWAIIETWHHGSIFEECRARLEVRRGHFVPDLLLCPFCLSHWSAIFAELGALSLLIDLRELAWHQYLGLPICILATTRLSNLLNDLFRRICRTPGRSVSDSEEHDQALIDISKKEK